MAWRGHPISRTVGTEFQAVAFVEMLQFLDKEQSGIATNAFL